MAGERESKLSPRWRLIVGILVLAIMLLGAVPTWAATITVTNLNDSGAGSLRQAIIDAKPGDTIDFSVTGKIILTGGELTIDNNLNIIGPGAANLTISGNNNSRVFNITAGTVTISGVTISDGLAKSNIGGGIYNQGTLALEGSIVSGNTATVSGGGIYNENGSVTLTNCSVSNNTTAEASGGGIANSKGNLTLINSTVSDNTGHYAGGINNYHGTTTLQWSTVSDNSAGNGGGGGICNTDGGLILTNSTVSGNTAGTDGGGIRNNGGNATLTNSTVSGNTVQNGGGGIYNLGMGKVMLTNSTVSGNTAQNGDGAGICNANGDVTLTNSTVRSNNTAKELGGGIYNQGRLILKSSTVSGNTANSHGGGIYNNETLKMVGADGVARLTNSTVSGNTAGKDGGGIRNRGHFDCKNTLIADNTASYASDYCGTLTSYGYNLIEDITGCSITGDLTGNIIGVDPKLGPLQDNSGPTFTHALLNGSPAIDAGSCYDIDGNLVTTDQRGVIRPQGAACDIGAFEVECFTLTVTKAGTGEGTVTSNPAGINCGMTCTASYASGTVVTLTATPDTYSLFTGWSGCGSASGNQCTVAMNADRSVTATFTSTFLLGDVNRDGVVDVLDARLCLQIATGFLTPTAYQECVTDVDEDGDVDLDDATLLAQYIIGLVDKLGGD